MFIEDNYSITRLFVTKTIKIIVREKQDGKTLFKFDLILQPIKELFLNDDWNIAYHLLTNDDYKKLFSLKGELDLQPFEAMTLVLCELGKYDRFAKFADIIRDSLVKILPDFNIDYINKCLKIGDNTITEEIWDRIIYLLKLSCGEKVTPPLTFDSEEARKFYLAQKAAEEKIKKLRAQKSGDVDGLSKMMLHITYVFPSFTMDYLWDQTMAQIQWLQKYAAGAVSYEVNAQAFAAGNVKKGKKLDFFIK